MAVKYVNKGGGLLGTLGNLAAIGGLIPGAQWLTPLGLGLSATDRLINGSGGGSFGDDVDALSKLKEVMNGWQNPASNNIAKSESKAAKDEVDKMSDEQLARRWGGYNQWRL